MINCVLILGSEELCSQTRFASLTWGIDYWYLKYE